MQVRLAATGLLPPQACALAAGSGAGVTAVCLTYPLDLVRHTTLFVIVVWKYILVY